MAALGWKLVASDKALTPGQIVYFLTKEPKVMLKYRVTTIQGNEYVLEGTLTILGSGAVQVDRAHFAPGQWVSCVPVEESETPPAEPECFQEPWTAVPESNGWAIYDDSGSKVADRINKQDAERIVQCVNACACISDDAFEQIRNEGKEST